MPESIIMMYTGPNTKVNCDGNCKKAWGYSSRPKIQISDDEGDFAYLTDNELGEAPVDPRTYEGGQSKPRSPQYFPNKWCVRECERCNKLQVCEEILPVEIKSFTQRVYNQPWKHTTEH